MINRTVKKSVIFVQICMLLKANSEYCLPYASAVTAIKGQVSEKGQAAYCC